MAKKVVSLNAKFLHVGSLSKPQFWQGLDTEWFISILVQCPSPSWYQTCKSMVQELPDRQIWQSVASREIFSQAWESGCISQECCFVLLSKTLLPSPPPPFFFLTKHYFFLLNSDHHSWERPRSSHITQYIYLYIVRSTTLQIGWSLRYMHLGFCQCTVSASVPWENHSPPV